MCHIAILLLLRSKRSALAYVYPFTAMASLCCLHGVSYSILAERSSTLSFFSLFPLFPRRNTKLWPADQQSSSCRVTRAEPHLRATKRRSYRIQPVYRQMKRRPSPYSVHLKAEPVVSIPQMARLSNLQFPSDLFLRNLRYQTVAPWRGCRCWQASSCSSTLGKQRR